ncbi:MAG: GNAT family N-acetyltransferase, partial [Chloroflexi bacterium]|nr:GNAT family N-acetyltransferase [Chloroflexota bacterium]
MEQEDEHAEDAALGQARDCAQRGDGHAGKRRIRWIRLSYISVGFRVVVYAVVHRRVWSANVVRASAGELLTARDIDQLGDADNITRYLRLCTDLLAPTRSIASIPAPVRTVETIAADVEAKKLQQQLANLEPYRLVDDDVFSVYCAPYHALGCFMHQIAVDREKTFRMVDEGTGQELDSDNFDSYYWHLWAWNKKKQEIVGAYRVGKIDEIIDEHGID